MVTIRHFLIVYCKNKLVNCFNNREVTLVADKLKRQWLCVIYFADSTRQLEGSFSDYLTTRSCS